MNGQPIDTWFPAELSNIPYPLRTSQNVKINVAASRLQPVVKTGSRIADNWK
jgi:hypothetical protein